MCARPYGLQLTAEADVIVASKWIRGSKCGKRYYRGAGSLAAVSKFIPTMNNLLPIPLVRHPAGAPDDFGRDSPILDLVKYDMLEEIKKRFQQPPFAGNINAKIISCGNPLI